MKPKRLDHIYNGQCETHLSDRSHFPSNSVDLIITSPPYADRRMGSYGGIKPDKYVEWISPICDELQRVLKPSGSLILNIKEHVKDGERQTYVLELILELKKRGWQWVEEYCWYKKNCYPGGWRNRFRDSWERCLHFTKERKFKMYQKAVRVPIGDWSKRRFRSMSEKDFTRKISGTNPIFARKVSNWLGKKKVFPHNVLVFETEHYVEPTTVIEFATECKNRNHSAVFPLELPDWFIRLFTRKGDIVLDPFIGIGTTAMACILLDRRFIGIELIKEYVKEAKSNIAEVRRLVSQK